MVKKSQSSQNSSRAAPNHYLWVFGIIAVVAVVAIVGLLLTQNQVQVTEKSVDDESALAGEAVKAVKVAPSSNIDFLYYYPLAFKYQNNGQDISQVSTNQLCKDSGYKRCIGAKVNRVLTYYDSVDQSCSGRVQYFYENTSIRPCYDTPGWSFFPSEGSDYFGSDCRQWQRPGADPDRYIEPMAGDYKIHQELDFVICQ